MVKTTRGMVKTVITCGIEGEGQLVELVDYLLAIREDERVALARTIHDELGGLLVSARMDVGWAESHNTCAEVVMRLKRIGVSLASAIDMERSMIEQLRPTLLDNCGLFEALRWYFKHACHRAKVRRTEIYPAQEIMVPPLVLSNIFRAVQTLLDCTFIEENLKSVKLLATAGEGELSIRVGHEHFGAESVDVLARFRNELGSVACRLAAVRGELSFDRHKDGIDYCVVMPLFSEPLAPWPAKATGH